MIGYSASARAAALKSKTHCNILDICVIYYIIHSPKPKALIG